MVGKFRESSIHTGVNKDDYYTPPEIFESMGATFDLDVCAPIGGVPWIPATSHYSLKDDGLSQPWNGRVWMNPPFSKPSPWMERFLNHADGVCLVGMSRSQWFSDAWEKLDAIVLCDKKIKFVTIDGERKNIFMPTIMGAIGSGNVSLLQRFGRRIR